MKLLITEDEFHTYKSRDLIPLKCENCGNVFRAEKHDIMKVNKGRGGSKKKTLQYCSRSCAAKKRIQTSNRSFKSRSKAEAQLCEIISEEFPDLELQFNNRKVLDSGLELDVYIPSLNVAIEVNGIFHYQPIHGKKKLENTKRKDRMKVAECADKGIKLFVIKIDEVKPKDMVWFLKTYFRRYIKKYLTVFD